MIIVHDSIIKEYIYFDRIKYSRVSLKFIVNIETTNVINSINSVKSTYLVFFINPTNSVLFTYPVSSINSTSSINSVFSIFFTNSTFSISTENKLQYLRKLYVLKHYNKEINNLDNYTKLNLYNLVSRYYHRRN